MITGNKILKETGIHNPSKVKCILFHCQQTLTF